MKEQGYPAQGTKVGFGLFCTFAETLIRMVQDIFPHRFTNSFRPDLRPQAGDFVLHYRKKELLLMADGDGFRLPRVSDLPEGLDRDACTYAFSLDDTPCFLVWERMELTDEGAVFSKVSELRTTPQAEIAWISMAGFHLWNWYSSHRFCGKCGVKMQHKADERALVCPECGALYFPQISPAIIVAITSGDRILLVRNSSVPGGRYTLVAGYADVGETIEDTLRREVQEEVGLSVKGIRYRNSQPWALSGSLMLGFTAEADCEAPLVVDGNELTEARWFKRGELPPHSSTRGIAGELIERFEQGLLD
jgi:NAD+ diphosphatase